MALSQVIMPKTGAEMEEGKIVSWKKQPGERVATGEILLEIETDKATMDVESPATGVLLRSLFAADEKVPATHLIAVIGEGNESAAEIEAFIKGITQPGSTPSAPVAPTVPEPAAAPAPQASSKGTDQRVKASPAPMGESRRKMCCAPQRPRWLRLRLRPSLATWLRFLP